MRFTSVVKSSLPGCTRSEIESPADRAAFLDRACDGNANVRLPALVFGGPYSLGGPRFSLESLRGDFRIIVQLAAYRADVLFFPSAA